ncbi:UDP-3-O-acyl-N-acetylglucosamine deacetylase [Telmatospirillum sp. J64-1]|uniref:UDP-3-O-acyl-N-acetylglucosamine deacetylase n=1 Tax=Telmatospirillum sp. J64-1 TaxID=2502183 RepID=UPI00115EC1AA|nr:UDP-3-O-acyl-N-acetylglucosamine deacetylase [Telmatospirillum sp. J64-1]
MIGRLPTPDIQAVSSEKVRPQRQHTLKSAITCKGVGLHSGAKITMTLRPGEANSGIVFRRVDIPGKGALIPAHWASVSDTRMNTCISNDQGVGVKTIEHLMAALAGMGIDNAEIDINGEEVPVMDGSAAPFLFLIECAGVVEQDAPRRAIRVLKPVVVTDGDKMASLMPSDSFSVRFEIDFSSNAINRQECALDLSEGAFKAEISRARTFGFEQEVSALRSMGLARGGSLDNAVVISSDGERVLNEEGLRYDDEFVRHKILDAVGDLYLAGAPLLGHFHGIRSGHALNNRLLRALFADDQAWEWADAGEEEGRALAAKAMPEALPLAANG